jgi:hypothetical protein
MSKNLRKIIKDIVKETFDNINDLPINLRKEEGENKIYYKFPFNNIEYAVEISKLTDIGNTQMPDEKLKNFVLEKSNGFIFSFGIIKNGIYYDVIDTKENKAIKIISFVAAIINKFLKENDVNVITFHAESSRDKIYDYIYRKYLKDEFKYYTAKEKSNYNRFYIKNDLYNEFLNQTNNEKKEI